MTETLKCVCQNCGAKYRLPVEYQGRSARCKQCGEKFSVPKLGNGTLEDSVLSWLNEADEEDAVDQPRVINMPSTTESDPGRRSKGPIRMKTGTSDDSKS
ncbi:MAG: hypothetical protein AB7Q17_04905 [Phycisphaerae bacterium]